MHSRDNFPNLLYQLTRCGYLAQDKNSMLGILWHLLHPLAMTVVLYAIFSRISDFQKIPNFALFILIGVTHFNFFTNATGRASYSMLAYRNLVINSSVPPETVVLQSVLLEAATFVTELVLILVLIATVGGGLPSTTPAYFFIPILLGCFTLGVSFFLAGAVVLLTDLLYIWGLFTRMLFFATPVFYSLSMLEKSGVSWLIELNPLATQITMSRSCLLVGEVPDISTWALMAGISLISLVSGWGLFRTLRVSIMDHL